MHQLIFLSPVAMQVIIVQAKLGDLRNIPHFGEAFQLLHEYARCACVCVCENAHARRHARIRKVRVIYKLPDKSGIAVTKAVKTTKR